ncbi:AAA family ATPase [Limosilactobacillus fermentum]
MKYKLYLSKSIEPDFSSISQNIKNEFGNIGITDITDFKKYISKSLREKFLKDDDNLEIEFTDVVPMYRQKNINKSLGTLVNESINKLTFYVIVIPVDKLQSRSAYISQQLIPTLTDLMDAMIDAPGFILNNLPIIILNSNSETYTDSNALSVISLNALPYIYYVDIFNRSPEEQLLKKGISVKYDNLLDAYNAVAQIKNRSPKLQYDSANRTLKLLLGNLKQNKSMTNEPYYYIFDVLPIIYLAIDESVNIDIDLIINWWDNYVKAGYTNKNMKSFINWISKLKNDKRDTVQKIYFGAPGTGKSYSIDSMIKDEKVKSSEIFRTTFHAEYSYSDFIGQIIPSRKYNKTSKQYDIEYSFKEGVFVRAVSKAYSDLSRKVYLIVEEMSRGNVASIFGDIFQLLDRERIGVYKGFSKYTIRNKNISDSIPQIANEIVQLPPNLEIYGTVNTSDQNVFTIDTAFKRRFDWQYVKTNPIKGSLGYVNDTIIKLYRSNSNKYEDIKWTDLYGTLNVFISDKRYLNLGEDKQIGPFFNNCSSGLLLNIST